MNDLKTVEGVAVGRRDDPLTAMGIDLASGAPIVVRPVRCFFCGSTVSEGGYRVTTIQVDGGCGHRCPEYVVACAPSCVAVDVLYHTEGGDEG